MTFDLLHIVDIVAYADCLYSVTRGRSPLSQPINFFLNYKLLYNQQIAHIMLCVCVCDLLIYVLSWPSYHGDGCMVTGGHTICFVKYTYYIISCDKLLQDFFFPER